MQKIKDCFPPSKKMSSFIFFLLLTMAMAFLLNWVYMQYLHNCPDCTHASKLQVEADKLTRQMGQTTPDDDIKGFLDEMM
jgi:hypothetical protein